MKERGKFCMVDGMDGVGKGVVIDAIVEFEKNRCRRSFDINQWWGTDLTKPPVHDYNPRFEDFKDAELLISSEPTYAGIGRRIRAEYIRNNGRDYSPELIANAYSLDRLELYMTTIIPARENAIDIIQSRGVVTSLVYQKIDSSMRGEAVMSTEVLLGFFGNSFAMNRPPSLLIIPIVEDVEELFKRLASREKQDDAMFERIEFQRRLKDNYSSKWLREEFEERGTVVKYLDAGISVESSKEQAVKIWREHLGLTKPFT